MSYVQSIWTHLPDRFKHEKGIRLKHRRKNSVKYNSGAEEFIPCFDPGLRTKSKHNIRDSRDPSNHLSIHFLSSAWVVRQTHITWSEGFDTVRWHDSHLVYLYLSISKTYRSSPVQPDPCKCLCRLQFRLHYPMGAT
jgi:hypothetical protein